MTTNYSGPPRLNQRSRLSIHNNTQPESTSKDSMGCVSSLLKTQQDSKKRKQDAKRMLVVQGIIGTGGFGKVLAVTLQQTGKWYAVKEVNKVDLLKHKSGHAMICSELDAMSKVGQHPFIVSLQLAYHDRLNCYLALDLKTGGDLRYYLRCKMIFEERDVAFYVACISSALNHIHSRNMLHRDIKPENIILDERGWPHLADFGVAHVHTAANSAKFGGTLTSTLASGTKQYLAPEVFCKEHIHGPESDYWALAVVAYELLHARRPFEKHCSINFITYLERGLVVKREQIKKEKFRRLLHPRGLSMSSDVTEIGTFMPAGSPRRAHFCTSATCSNYSSASGSTSRESSAYFPGISGSRSGSIDESEGYCSSAHVTPLHTPIHTPTRKGAAEKYALLTHQTNGNGSGNESPAQRRCSQCGSRSSSPSDGTEQELSSGSGSSDTTAQLDLNRVKINNKTDLSVQIPLSPSRTSSFGSTHTTGSRGIGYNSTDSGTPKNTNNLPVIASSANSAFSTPKRASKDTLYLPPTSNVNGTNGTTSPVQKGLFENPDTNTTNTTSNTTTENIHRAVFQRAPYGDHWAVDDDSLPSDLRVSIPHSNVWLGPLSHECISFLKGMFDIRPSHRLSSRDIDAVRTHAWLSVHSVDNWDDLYNHRYTPNFRPGKRFMREIFADPTNVMLMGAGNVLSDPDDDWTHSSNNSRSSDDSANGTGGVLTPEQRTSFRGFRYTSEQFQDIFRNEEPESVTGALKTSSSTVTNTTHVY